MSFQHLLAPLTVRGRTLRNRIVMGSMHTRLDAVPDAIERKAAFYGARARGGTAMIISGGYAPNPEGRMEEGAAVFDSPAALDDHRASVAAIHAGGALACLQILHAGRYARVPHAVGASSLPAPINKRAVHALTDAEILATIDDYARTAALACDAGYDAVEAMGSEGYLITQFLALRTNTRTDRWGGDFEARLRFPLAVVAAVRGAIGPGRILVYRISALDLVEGGLDAAEIARQAQAVADAGADILDTGIGWHEARVPTIGYRVPRGAWRDATARLKQAVKIPVMATNRINTPELAEALIAEGTADLVSLARPLLADPDFAAKTAAGRTGEINVCIACNQACLDHIFTDRVATCLVNPRAGHETLLPARGTPAAAPKRVAIVGAGAAGLACAIEAAERGHAVTLFEAGSRIGGQLLLAARIPGKEFAATLAYFSERLASLGVAVRLNTAPDIARLAAFQSIVVAAGVTPRRPAIAGIEGPNVHGYEAVLAGRVTLGPRVAIIGAGGIGFDVACYLTEPARAQGEREAFLEAWSVDPTGGAAGGLLAAPPIAQPPAREVTLVQRKPGALGKSLGLTTGWTIRAELARRGVTMLAGAEYVKIDASGLHIRLENTPRLIAATDIVVCAGQESRRELVDALAQAAIAHQVIGGAARAGELDALRAIREGVEAAIRI